MSIQTIHNPPNHPVQTQPRASWFIFLCIYLFIPAKSSPFVITHFYLPLFLFYFHITSLMLCTKHPNDLLLFVCEFVCVMTARKKYSRRIKREWEKVYKNKRIDWKIMWKIIIHVKHIHTNQVCSPWEKIEQ